jgi:hypothetical protein
LIVDKPIKNLVILLWIVSEGVLRWVHLKPGNITVDGLSVY